MSHLAFRIHVILAAIVFLQTIFIFNVQPNSKTSNTRYYKIEAKQDESWPEKVVSDPVALFTLILTAFTGLLFLATRNLWTATKDLVRGAEQTTTLQLRAYVSITGGAVLLVPNSMDGYTVHVSFKNSGSTPAYNFLTRIEGNIFDFQETPFRNVPPHVGNQKSILGPGDQFHINTQSALITTDQLELIRQQRRAIFVWGSAEYTDIFGNDRYFRYRCRMSGHEGTFPDGRVGWLLSPHPMGYGEDSSARLNSLDNNGDAT